MEEEQGNYSQEDESRGVDFHLGIEGTNSNGHGEEMNENTNMAKTIKNLQKDVQSHKVDNERLMRAKEQQDGFNRIEKKLVKESILRKYGSHKPSDEKRKERSVSRHHHHSPRHSNKRTCKSPSSSPVKRYKRFGVDELREEMNKIKPPTFDGEHKKDKDAKTWLLGMRKYFQLYNYSSHAEGRISIYQLKGKASMWWYQLVQVQHSKEKSVTWREFKKYFEKKYLAKRYYDKKIKEFFEIKIESMTIDEFEKRFLELLKYVSFITDEIDKIQRYLSGLPSFISEKI
jgi:hypothetical protein